MRRAVLLVVLALAAVVPLGVGATQARVEAEWPKTMAEAMAIFILLSVCYAVWLSKKQQDYDVQKMDSIDSNSTTAGSYVRSALTSLCCACSS